MINPEAVTTNNATVAIYRPYPAAEAAVKELGGFRLPSKAPALQLAMWRLACRAFRKQHARLIHLDMPVLDLGTLVHARSTAPFKSLQTARLRAFIRNGTDLNPPRCGRLAPWHSAS